MFLGLWGLNPTNLGIPTATQTLSDAITNVAKLIVVLIGLFSVIMIMYGGLQMVLSAGSPQRFSKARETLLYAVAGVTVSIAAYAIISLVTNYIK